MVTSLMLKSMRDIEVDNESIYYREEEDANGCKIKLSEIPFIRYRFEQYNQEEIEYIKKSKEKFKYSVHLVEIDMAGDFKTEFDRVREKFDDVAVYLYISIDNKNVALCEFNEEQVEKLELVNELDSVDRLVLKDKSTTLYTEEANKLMEMASKLSGMDRNMVGICGSPMSFVGDNKCLSALRARELAAMYLEEGKFALPTSNHECMECGGCIRYKVVNIDLKAAPNKKKKSSSEGFMNEPEGLIQKEKAVKKKSEPKKKPSKKGVTVYDTSSLMGLKF